MNIELNVNGQRQAVDTAADTPLIYVLRNQLGLTAAKLGCGLEQCGACAVLVDGEVRLSCVAPVATFVGKQIVTLEGLRDSALGKRVCDALGRRGAAQCGYCTPGIVVTLTAVFQREAAPTEATLRAALQPHLCRCGAQARVLRAARDIGAMTP